MKTENSELKKKTIKTMKGKTKQSKEYTCACMAESSLLDYR